jgi:ABC-type branched-subunit amino acid transport system ATPase component
VSVLEARGLSKSFGGVAAVRAAAVDIRPAEIHGLIGPNGSGKTTMLNLLTGYYRPDSGSIVLDGEELSTLPVQDRARRGIARTFQKPRLLPTLSVLDNAMLGAWRDVRAGFVSTALASPATRREEAALRERAAELLHGVGLGAMLHRRAGLLEHGAQRFLEIARALAARPRFVLLDEPAGGLSGAEIEHLGTICATLRECGIGILLVEHHTDLVFRLCDRVTTLDLGRVIKHGTPAEVRIDPEVVRVYLGA